MSVVTLHICARCQDLPLCHPLPPVHLIYLCFMWFAQVLSPSNELTDEPGRSEMVQRGLRVQGPGRTRLCDETAGIIAYTKVIGTGEPESQR